MPSASRPSVAITTNRPGVALHIDADGLADAVAERVAQLLAERTPRALGPWLDVTEAAERMRCSRQRIHDLVSQGKLVPARDGRRVLLHVEVVDAYLRDGLAETARGARVVTPSAPLDPTTGSTVDDAYPEP